MWLNTWCQEFENRKTDTTMSPNNRLRANCCLDWLQLANPPIDVEMFSSEPKLRTTEFLSVTHLVSYKQTHPGIQFTLTAHTQNTHCVNGNIMSLLEGCSRMMSVIVKSRDWTVFSLSAMLVISRTQATVGQASIFGPMYFHALFCLCRKNPAGEKGNISGWNTPQGMVSNKSPGRVP